MNRSVLGSAKISDAAHISAELEWSAHVNSIFFQAAQGNDKRCVNFINLDCVSVIEQ